MTRKVRLLLITASVPLFTGCADTVTGPDDAGIRRDTTEETLVTLGCRDLVPWGKAPCKLG